MGGNVTKETNAPARRPHRLAVVHYGRQGGAGAMAIAVIGVHKANFWQVPTPRNIALHVVAALGNDVLRLLL